MSTNTQFGTKTIRVCCLGYLQNHNFPYFWVNCDDYKIEFDSKTPDITFVDPFNEYTIPKSTKILIVYFDEAYDRFPQYFESVKDTYADVEEVYFIVSNYPNDKMNDNVCLMHTIFAEPIFLNYGYFIDSYGNINNEIIDKILTVNKNCFKPLTTVPTKFALAVQSSTLNDDYRTNFINYVSDNYKKVDFYGNGREFSVPKIHNNRYKDKYELAKKYKFMFCCENSNYYGYNTEKIIEGSLTHCVPIYYGSANPFIQSIMNENAYIHIDKNDDMSSELNKIISVNDNKDLYEYMMHENIFKDMSPIIDEVKIYRQWFTDILIRHGLIDSKEYVKTYINNKNIYVKTKGRLGNVLYEIFAALTYCKRHDLTFNKIHIKTDFLHHVDYYKKSYLLRFFENSGININFVNSLPEDKIEITENNFLDDLTIGTNYVFDDYFQNNDCIDYDYIKSIITIPSDINKKIHELYPGIDNSVVCHVRRGDYLDLMDYIQVLTPEYIHRIYNKYFIGKQLVVVSDDIKWCQDNLSDIGCVTFSNQNELIDLMTIMSGCGVICSTSSFSTIGSVLNNNPNKTIVICDEYYKKTHPNGLVAKHIPDYFILESLYIDSSAEENEKIRTELYKELYKYKQIQSSQTNEEYITRPRISICTCNYNKNKNGYLEKCIKSVLNQSFQDFEFCIVDDCSDDGSQDIIKKYAEQDSRIKYILRNSNNFIDARNMVYNIASGDYIVNLDSDDELINDCLEYAVKYFDEHPEYDCLCPDIKQFDGKKEKKTYIKYDVVDYNTLKEDNFILTKYVHIQKYIGNFGSFFFKRSLLSKFNGKYFYDGLLSGEDQLFQFALIYNGAVCKHIKMFTHNITYIEDIYHQSKTAMTGKQVADYLKSHIEDIKKFYNFDENVIL